ncbi:uracil-DNA glycosylase [Pseudoxanthobacter sp. M-2]|uniref:uracil-DNA glycosylase n=1 Tax=Pseudoxanthobacter sp. M-2 TaxID=3078754 RepID=UPI0038FCE9B7
MSDPRALIALLEWYDAVGVDAVVLEQAIDRLAAPPPAPVGEAPPRWQDGGEGGPSQGPPGRLDRAVQPAPAVTVTLPDEGAIEAARADAAAAESLEALREVMLRFEGCNLKKTATQLVFADGNPAARIMLIGEAPGREEDLDGRPFVGRSGKLLDRMLAAIGLDRSSVYIVNVVPWRPPGNRTPSAQETEICRPFLTRQIELVDPAVLVSLGGPAAKALTGTSDGILKLRGKWLSYRVGERDVPCLATLHPAYLLRQPLQKRLAWRDFLSLRRKLDEIGC